MAFAWSRLAISDWRQRPTLDRGALRALVKLGGWQVAAQSGALFAGQADRYLLGALLQPQFVGFYRCRAAAGRGGLYRRAEDRRDLVPVLQHVADGG